MIEQSLFDGAGDPAALSAESAESTRKENSFYQGARSLFKIERNIHTAPHSMRSHHYHDNYELYYLYSGDRYYFIKDNVYHITRGSFVLIKPYDIHSTSNFAKSGYDRILITFDREFLAGFSAALGDVDLFRCFEEDIHIVPLDFTKQGYVETLLFSMLEEYKNKAAGYEQILQAAMVQLLLMISRYAGDGESDLQRSVNAVHKHVSDAVSYINSHYAEPISLSAVAEKFFISQSHFSRIFKRVTGIPFTKYVNGVRIKEAQRLLESEHMSIAAVSCAVGYTNTTHFGRAFKSITGMTAHEYKRMQRKA